MDELRLWLVAALFFGTAVYVVVVMVLHPV